MLVAVKEALRALPCPVSEREFRLAAQRLDVNHLRGRQMMVKPDDVLVILKEMERCRLKRRAKRR